VSAPDPFGANSTIIRLDKALLGESRGMVDLFDACAGV
jgi:hypothetical protein